MATDASLGTFVRRHPSPLCEKTASPGNFFSLGERLKASSGQVRPGRCRRRGVSPDPPRGACARAVRAERRAGRAAGGTALLQLRAAGTCTVLLFMRTSGAASAASDTADDDDDDDER